MVRLLSEVIKDMREFFVVLFYSTLAFSFILYLRNPSLTFSQYLIISYKLDLGYFNTDYTALFDWVIFFVATMINPIVMLNLLISIMGDTYSKVQESNDIANYQELTEMIIEIEKLMFWKKKINDKHYLQQCDFLQRNEDSSDKILEKIRVLKVQIMKMEFNMKVIKNSLKKNSLMDVEGSLYDIKNEQISMKNEIKLALEKNTALVSELAKKNKNS